MQKTSSVRLLPVVMLAIAVLIALKIASHLVAVDGSLGVAVAQEAEDTTSQENPEPAMEETIDPEATGQLEEEPEEEVAPRRVFTAAEQEVLESLLARRTKLDEHERALQLREKLLEAAEKRVEERITELKTIEQRIEAAFGKQDEERKSQLKNLVSMYRNMKPKDAARIFDRLDMTVLIGVVQQMKARYMAPILARMDSAVAERLTVELARRAEMNVTK